MTEAAHVALPSPYISGYAGPLSGEEFEYHSPLPDVVRSLLVRSEDAARGIEWETAVVPTDFDGDVATFVLLAGIDATDDTRTFDLSINGHRALQFETPRTASVGTLTWRGDEGVSAELRVTLVDRYADAMGYLFLHVPRKLVNPGEPLLLSVAGESARSRTWFMVFMAEIEPEIAIRGVPAVVRTPDGPRQTVRVDVLYLDETGTLRMEATGDGRDAELGFGLTRLELEVPAVEQTTVMPFRFRVDDEWYQTALLIDPVAPLDLYVIHHTHLDIGYTHLQDEVERLQWNHLEEALRLGRASEDLPPEARFVWHPEGVWAVESYLESHGESESEALLEGIRRGWIHIDGLYTNLLTGLATGEGLVRTMAPAREISEAASVPLRSAMFSDIPGMSWGVVGVLAQAGVRYLSIGPNRWHRIGSFLDTWADRPFWWESPSGQERVLAWVHGGGYSMFHTGLGYEHLETRLDEERVFAYVDSLGARGWPHGIAAIRYNIGSDNGPPDSTLSATVTAWNERYVTPRLVVSSAARALHALEEEAGDELPIVRGDLTGYWEDGAASSARETALMRRAAESLAQTETLAAITGTRLDPMELTLAWRQVLLFLEHTWGSWNSISEPEAEFTVSQWERKKAFADEAVARAAALREQALGVSGHGRSVLEVLNTSPWARSDVVVLAGSDAAHVGALRAEGGVGVPMQRLADGGLAFVAEEVPGWGARRYAIESSGLETREPTTAADPHTGTTLDNGLVRVTLDPVRGTILSLQLHASNRDLVPSGQAMNEYLYVPGRDPATVVTGGQSEVRITDVGPVVWTAVVSREAPGTESVLETTVRLFAGSERVEIGHRFDKTMTCDPEAVLFRFPVDLDRAETMVGGAWGAWRAELDQPPGANRNYSTVERWVDMHDGAGGLQIVSVDVPGIQLGSIGTDATVAGWRNRIDPEPVLYSYVMNNYWETNYRASQDGPHELTCTLRPHAGFDEAVSERFALETAQPLVVRRPPENVPSAAAPIDVVADRSVVSLLRALGNDEGLLLRLYNPSNETDVVGIAGPSGADLTSLQRTDPWGEPLPGGEVAGDVSLAPHEVATFRIRP